MSSVDELRAITVKLRKIAKDNKKNKSMVDVCDVVEQLAEVVMGVVKKQEKHVSIFRRIDDIIQIDLKRHF